MPSFANPTSFLKFAQIVQPIAAALCAIFFAAGIYFALFASPADYQQGEAVRIMYVHVPAAWMALGVYFFMGLASAAFLIWRHPVADIAARESALLGAGFTFICLATGSLWGKPMWGTWWVWDARLTSVLVLFFLYIGYMALENAVEGSEKGRKACAVLALIGLANLPVIRFSVEWWNTLHQPASVLRKDGPAIAPEMLVPLLLMAGAFSLFFIWLLLMRAVLVQHALLHLLRLRQIQLKATQAFKFVRQAKGQRIEARTQHHYLLRALADFHPRLHFNGTLPKRDLQRETVGHGPVQYPDFQPVGNFLQQRIQHIVTRGTANERTGQLGGFLRDKPLPLRHTAVCHQCQRYDVSRKAGARHRRAICCLRPDSG